LPWHQRDISPTATSPEISLMPVKALNTANACSRTSTEHPILPMSGRSHQGYAGDPDVPMSGWPSLASYVKDRTSWPAAFTHWRTR
jgi:hypothetical protein